MGSTNCRRGWARWAARPRRSTCRRSAGCCRRGRISLGLATCRTALFVSRDRKRPGPALFALLRESVERRGIEVRYQTPASELIVVDGAVTGAVVGGTPIRARSVILAAGGFEYDAQLRDAHLPVPVIPVGHPGNTGDALRLASQAGAAAWHMSAFFGWFAFSHPDHVAGFPLDVHAPSFIYVDADGRRFADETGWEVHDKVRCVTAYLPRRRNRPHMPGHIVFDEAARLAGPLNGIVGTPNDYAWSADNSAEVDAGWIKRAGSAEELAAAICADELPRHPTRVRDRSPTSSAAHRRRSSRSSRRCTRSRCTRASPPRPAARATTSARERCDRTAARFRGYTPPEQRARSGGI